MNTSIQSVKPLIDKGLKAYHKQDYQSAIEYLNQALSGSSSSGDKLISAEIANDLSLCYLKTGDSQKAWGLVQGTDELFEKGNDKHRQAIALANQGAILESLHKFEQAIEKYEASSRLLKEIGNQEERSLLLKSLSELHMKMGHQLDAMATMQIALDNEKNPSLIERFLKKLLKIPFHT
jgi:tetratricopeptide (TPR) repeat protein